MINRDHVFKQKQGRKACKLEESVFDINCKIRVNLNFSKKMGKHDELAATLQVENLEFF